MILQVMVYTLAIFTTLASPSAVAALQPAIVAAAQAVQASAPLPAAPQPLVQQASASPPFKVRISILPVEHAPTSNVGLQGPGFVPPPPVESPDAVARARLEKYYDVLTTKLRAVPGLTLVTQEATDVPGLADAAMKLGVSGIEYEVWMSIAEDRKAIAVEAVSSQPSRLRVLWATDPNMLPGRPAGMRPLFVLPVVDVLPEDPQRDMENLVERMRRELFPRDPVRLDTWMSELRDPQLETTVRMAALNQLLNYSAPVGRLSQTIQPAPALISAAMEFAMSAGEPATRLRVWQTFRGLRIGGRIDLSVLMAPAMQALPTETDPKVQLELVTLIGVNPEGPEARAALVSVARSDRQELVRMAARHVLYGDEEWNDYFVAKLTDPQVPDAERRELINYVYSVSGGNASAIGKAAIKLDEAATRSLGGVLKGPGIREVRTAAESLLQWAGISKVAHEVQIEFLRSSAGQSALDKELRSWVLGDLTLRARLGLPLEEDVRHVVEEISARDPDLELREKARQALQVTVR